MKGEDHSPHRMQLNGSWSMNGQENTLLPSITPLMADKQGSLPNVVQRCCRDKSNYYTLVKIPFRERYIAAVLKEVC